MAGASFPALGTVEEDSEQIQTTKLEQNTTDQTLAKHQLPVPLTITSPRSHLSDLPRSLHPAQSTRTLHRKLFKALRTSTPTDILTLLRAASAHHGIPLATLLATLRTPADETALHLVAAHHPHPASPLSLLLTLGALPCARGHRTHARTPLHDAARRRDAGGGAAVRALLAGGARGAAPHAGARTPRLGGGAARAAESVRALLGSGAQPLLVNADGWHAGHVAARGGAAEVVAEVVKEGGRELMRGRTRNGRTMLHCAARGGSVACVRGVVEAGAEVQAVEAGGMCAAHEAAAAGEVAVLRVLLEGEEGLAAGLEGDVGGLDVVMHAVVGGGDEAAEAVEAVKAAVEREGRSWREVVCKRDRRGNSAGDMARWRRRTELSQLLRESGDG